MGIYVYSINYIRNKEKKKSAGTSWRMDETYIKVKGEWMYLYRVVDKVRKYSRFFINEEEKQPVSSQVSFKSY